jgi:DNA modification methylase
MKKAIVKISHLVEVPELKQYYTHQSIDELATSIDVDGGMRTPIVVNEQLVIIDGFRRVEAMIQLGKESIDVLIDDVEPTIFERIIRNMYRTKTTDDHVKELKSVFDKFPKKMGQKNKEGKVYNRTEEISKALNKKYSGKDTITKLEFILNNDIENNTLSKGIIEKNWKVETCFEFLSESMKVDIDNKYGFTKLLLDDKLNINEANSLITQRAVADKKFEYSFVIPDKITVYNDDCRQLTNLLEGKPIIDLLQTSIPFWNLRSYKGCGVRQLGQEETKEEYAINIGQVFKTLEPCLKDTSNMVVNIGETYIDGQAQSIPFLIKDAIQKHTSLIYKDCIIWSKKNSRPQGESVKRLQNSIEYLFWFVKDIDKAKYNLLTFPNEGKGPKITTVKDVSKDGSVSKRNKSISKTYGKLVSHIKEQEIENIISTSIGKDHELYSICSSGFPAPMSPMLTVTLTLMLSDEGNTVCDPFGGSQISGKISRLLNRRYVSTELSKEYFNIGCERLQIADKEFNRLELDTINQIAYGDENLVSIAA